MRHKHLNYAGTLNTFRKEEKTHKGKQIYDKILNICSYAIMFEA
jgi:uncharacterized protein YjbK